MLYRIINNVPQAWKGEPINDVQHPLNIENLWTEAELNAIGLYTPTPGQQPTGDDTILSEEIVIENGVPAIKYTIQPYDIADARKSVECTKLQAKAALHEYGLLDSVEAMVASSDFITQLAWKEAATFKRTSPLLDAIKANLTWPTTGAAITDEEIDTIFVRANELEF